MTCSWWVVIPSHILLEQVEKVIPFPSQFVLNWIEFENEFAYNYIISGKKLIQQTVILKCVEREFVFS